MRKQQEATTQTEKRIAKHRAADWDRRAMARAIREERMAYQTSGLIMAVAEVLNLPGSVALGKLILKRRVNRRRRKELQAAPSA